MALVTTPGKDWLNVFDEINLSLCGGRQPGNVNLGGIRSQTSQQAADEKPRG
jgi:hypothetical protein